MLAYLRLVIKICNIVMLFKTLSSCLFLPLCLKTVDTWTMWVWITLICGYFSIVNIIVLMICDWTCGFRESVDTESGLYIILKLIPVLFKGQLCFKTIIYAGISYVFQEKKCRCCILQKNRTFIFLKFIIFLCSLGTF